MQQEVIKNCGTCGHRLGITPTYYKCWITGGKDIELNHTHCLPERSHWIQRPRPLNWIQRLYIWIRDTIKWFIEEFSS